MKNKKLHIKKNDRVLVLSGREQGKKGKVIRIYSGRGRAMVEGLNIIKKHQRPSQSFQGGIVDRPNSLHISKLMLVCPRCSKPARVGRKMEEDRRVRYCKKCNEVIDKV